MDRHPALSKITRELAPEIMAVFDRGTTRYDISSSDVVLGQLRRDRQYGLRDVFLSTTLFTSDFAEALAVFLHEHAHIFGHDGGRGFTDALTELIESIIRHRDALARHEESWEQARKAVTRERKMTGAGDEFEELHEWVSSLSEDELRTLVGEIPPLTLSKLRRKRGLEDAPSATN